jgi:hypothetical protein
LLASVVKLVVCESRRATFGDFESGAGGTAARRATARIGSAEENSRESIVIAQLSVLGYCLLRWLLCMSAVADDVLRFVEYSVGEPSVVKKQALYVCESTSKLGKKQQLSYAFVTRRILSLADTCLVRVRQCSASE